MKCYDSEIIQLDNNRWALQITDIIYLFIEEPVRNNFTYSLVESFLLEKEIFFSTEPRPDLEKSLIDIFNLIYFYLNKNNRVFEYEEIEYLRKYTLVYFGENFPEKLGKELSFSKNLLTEAYKNISIGNYKLAVNQLIEAIEYDTWSVDINLALLACYVQMKDYDNSQDIVYQLYTGLSEKKMIFQIHQQQKFDELRKLINDIEPPTNREIDNDYPSLDEL